MKRIRVSQINETENKVYELISTLKEMVGQTENGTENQMLLEDAINALRQVTANINAITIG